MNFIFNIVSLSLSVITKRLPYPVAKKTFFGLLNRLETIENKLFTYHQRPVFASDVNFYRNHHENNIATTAIVLQGPIIHNKSFTLETVKQYKRNYPHSIIIVSTWKNQDEKQLSLIEKEGVYVLLNSQPEKSGPLNINYQIASTIKGINFAKSLGAEFVIKTRCDQRFYAPNVLEYLYALILTFPLPLKFSQKLKYRIVSPNFTTLKYRTYGIADMIMYGHVDDMLLYWGADFDFREKENTSNISIGDYAKLRYAETYLCTEFLKKIEWEIQWTFQDSWEAYKNLFIIIDYTSLDLFWLKYNVHEEYRFKYYQDHTYELFTFSDWLTLQHNVLVAKKDSELISIEQEGRNFY